MSGHTSNPGMMLEGWAAVLQPFLRKHILVSTFLNNLYLCWMLKRFQFALRYLKYWLKAKTKTESDFVNELINDVFKSKQQYYDFKEIEGIRSALKKIIPPLKLQILEQEVPSIHPANEKFRILLLILQNLLELDKSCFDSSINFNRKLCWN